MVTLPITLDPCSFLSVANANCFVGTCDSSVSCNVEIDRMDDDDSREEAPPPLRRRRDFDAWASEFMVSLYYEPSSMPWTTCGSSPMKNGGLEAGGKLRKILWLPKKRSCYCRPRSEED